MDIDAIIVSILTGSVPDPNAAAKAYSMAPVVLTFPKGCFIDLHVANEGFHSVEEVFVCLNGELTVINLPLCDGVGADVELFSRKLLTVSVAHRPQDHEELCNGEVAAFEEWDDGTSQHKLAL